MRRIREVRRKDKPPKGVGKPDLLSAPEMESLDKLTREVLTVSKDEIERREAENKNRRLVTE